jgi:hypothetical protein
MKRLVLQEPLTSVWRIEQIATDAKSFNGQIPVFGLSSWLQVNSGNDGLLAAVSFLHALKCKVNVRRLRLLMPESVSLSDYHDKRPKTLFVLFHSSSSKDFSRLLLRKRRSQ